MLTVAEGRNKDQLLRAAGTYSVENKTIPGKRNCMCSDMKHTGSFIRCVWACYKLERDAGVLVNARTFGFIL